MITYEFIYNAHSRKQPTLKECFFDGAVKSIASTDFKKRFNRSASVSIPISLLLNFWKISSKDFTLSIRSAFGI